MSRPGIDATIADRVTLGFTILGAVACVLRYLLRFPIWPDEAFFAINIARRAPSDLMTPLDYHQVAPPLYTLAVDGATSLFGFNEWSLRLVSVIAMVAALFVFRALARRILDGWASVFAVAIFASSYWMIRHGSEVKPYAVDMLWSVSFLWMVAVWFHAKSRAMRLRMVIAMSLMAAVGFAVSFPSALIGGGVVLFMGWHLIRSTPRRLIEPFVIGLALVAGFGIVWVLHTSKQFDSEASYMQEYWVRGFPPNWSPIAITEWLVRRATGEMMPYPVGGKYFGSVATTIAVVIGGWSWMRSPRRDLLPLIFGPLAMALVAAAIHRYPFGAPTRCQLYLAPLFILLAGEGLQTLATRMERRRPTNFRPIVLGVLTVIIVGTMARDVISPAKNGTDRTIRDLSRVLWQSDDLDGTPTWCLRENLGTTLSPEWDNYQNLLPDYLCGVHIYGRPGAVSSDQLAATNACQIVIYHIEGRIRKKLRREWLASFQESTGLRHVASTRIPIPLVDNHERQTGLDIVEVMRFERIDATE